MEYIVHIGIIFCIFAILGLSLNLVVGYTGLLSLAHAAFFGTGAYALAILTTDYGLGFPLSVTIAMCISAASSFLIGLILSQFKDDYFALVSLGFTVIVYNVLLNWQSFTHGPLGIAGISKPSFFSLNFTTNTDFLMLSGAILIGIAALCVF